jgi:hypothetical protein
MALGIHRCLGGFLGAIFFRKEVFLTIEKLATEVGQTVRAALESWPKTVRLVILIAVLVGAAAIWTHYCL